jgi:hypothetical protein
MRRRFLIPVDLENRVLLVVLTALLVVSIAGSVIGVNVRWQIPLIFLALIVIIRLLTPVAQIHMNVKYLRQLSASATVKPFASVTSFYEDLRHALSAAESTVDLTHIRDNPPSDFARQSNGWYEATLEWAQNGASRSVRRLISVRGDAMQAWASELRRLTDQVPNFQVRVVVWSIDAPAINMAIFDERVVFLAVSGEVFERAKGIGIENKEVAHYFNSYYEKLWHASRPLGEYLDSQRSRATRPSP